MEIEKIAKGIQNKLELRGGLKQVWFVACGGSLTALYLAKYFLERESKNLRIGYCNSSEFVHATPNVISSNTVVVLACQRGTTPETIEAVKVCKKKGGISIVLTNIADSPITQVADYSCTYLIGEKARAEDQKPSTGLKVALELLNNSEGYQYYNEMRQAFATIDELVMNVHTTFLPQAQKMAKELNNAKLIYVLGSGPSWGSAHQESICVFMEMQWINASSIHSGDYFHGPFEMTEENQPFILLINDGETRELDLRAKAFLEKHNKKHFILDAKELGLEKVNSTVREFFNPILLTNTLHVFNSCLALERNHPMTIRRYMWKEQY